MQRALVLLVGFGGALVGCAAPIPDGPLTDLSGWTAMASVEDPWDDRPAEAECDPYGWGEEDGVIEIDTGICHYLTLSQPLLRDLEPGERIEVDVWHLGLWAERPAEGHASVELDGARWDARPRIPSTGRAWIASFEVEERVEAGTPIFLHVHNHGANNWRFAPPVSR